MQYEDTKPMQNRSVSTNLEDKETDILSLILSYLHYWPLYLLLLFLFGVLAWLYITLQEPLYPVETSILFLENNDAGKSNAVDNLMLDLKGIGGGNINVDNELLILKSREIIKQTLEESGAYVDITSRSGIRTKVWYDEVPFNFALEDSALSRLLGSYSFEVECLSGGKCRITLSEENDKKKIELDSFPSYFHTSQGLVIVRRNKNVSPSEEQPQHFKVSFSSPLMLARKYTLNGTLSAAKLDKQSSLAMLKVVFPHKKKGEDFLVKLVEVYNKQRAIDKNITAQKTYDFINERIKLIGSELSNTEMQLEEAKRKQGVIGVEDLGLAVGASQVTAKFRMELETEMKLMDNLLSMLNDPSKKYELIPGFASVRTGANAGASAPLVAAIQAHNAMLQERNTLLKEASEEHPRLLAINSNIEQSRNSIRTAAEITRKELAIQLGDVKAQEKEYNATVAEAPTFERVTTILNDKELFAVNSILCYLPSASKPLLS